MSDGDQRVGDVANPAVDDARVLIDDAGSAIDDGNVVIDDAACEI